MRQEHQHQDPYAPPPRHKDRSGGVVRFAIVAALLGAAAWGYAEFASGPSESLVAEQSQEQRMADAGYEVIPEQIPSGAAPTNPTSTATPSASAQDAPPSAAIAP